MSQPDEFRPGSLRHLVGQNHVRQVVGSALDYAFQEQAPFPHALALGPAGVGKTAIARVIAAELAPTFHEVLGSAITSPAESTPCSCMRRTVDGSWRQPRGHAALLYNRAARYPTPENANKLGDGSWTADVS